jgi:hypothetical protein
MWSVFVVCLFVGVESAIDRVGAVEMLIDE